MARMTRLAVAAVLGSALVSTSAIAAPKKKPAKEQITAAAPNVGDTLPVNGAPGWPTQLSWLYDVPSFQDSTGKVVIHWFCRPKVTACVDDLARIVNLKENQRVYVIAYIAATNPRDVKKLDPIRESEGVGRGTVAYGKQVVEMQRLWGFMQPTSVVVDVDGKISLVTTGTVPSELDLRDQRVQQLSAKIREYTATSEGPKLVKPNEKFQLAMKVELANWLRYSKKTPMTFKVTVPPDIKCDATTLTTAQMKIQDQSLVAAVNCTGPRGSYEARGTLNFGYEQPGGGGQGLGTDGASWRFEIKDTGLKP